MVMAQVVRYKVYKVVTVDIRMPFDTANIPIRVKNLFKAFQFLGP